jgi:hypothetical protein
MRAYTQGLGNNSKISRKLCGSLGPEMMSPAQAQEIEMVMEYGPMFRINATTEMMNLAKAPTT